MMASTVKGPPPANSLFSSSPSDPQAAGFVEVKQIEQDALRKSPAEIMATHQNGQILFQGGELILLMLCFLSPSAKI